MHWPCCAGNVHILVDLEITYRRHQVVSSFLFETCTLCIWFIVHGFCGTICTLFQVQSWKIWMCSGRLTETLECVEGRVRLYAWFDAYIDWYCNLQNDKKNWLLGRFSSIKIVAQKAASSICNSKPLAFLTYLFICECIYARNANMQTCVRTCFHACVYISTHICVYMYVSMHTYMYAHTRTHMRTYTHIVSKPKHILW